MTTPQIQKIREVCDFCKGTGVHLCPDVAEPIVIPCTKKGCPFVKQIASQLTGDPE